MTRTLFDQHVRVLRRQRASRAASDLFLHERAFADILERLSLVQRRFRSALVLGSPVRDWAPRLQAFVGGVHVIDGIDDLMTVEPATFDLCVTVGALETANDLRHALLAIRLALQPDSLFLGAAAGADTLPGLRAAMRAADEAMGSASPHVHPRIDPAALSGLLTEAGFAMPVVDVDRVEASYPSLWDLARDLRAMGCTNILAERSKRPLTRAAAFAAADHFAAAASDGRTIERFELIHLAAWTPAEGPPSHG